MSEIGADLDDHLQHSREEEEGQFDDVEEGKRCERNLGCEDPPEGRIYCEGNLQIRAGGLGPWALWSQGL